MNRLAGKLFYCFAVFVLSLFISNPAEACMNVSVAADSMGNPLMAVTNCAPPPAQYINEEINKTPDVSNYVRQTDIVSTISKNSELNPSKYNSIDKANSYIKTTIADSKYSMANIIDNRNMSKVAANNAGNMYSVSYSDGLVIGIQPKDTAVRADKIAMDDNGNIVISSPKYDRNKLLGYYEQKDEVSKL